MEFSDELLAARERLLEGIMATWPKKLPALPATPPPSLPRLSTIDIEAEAAYVEECRREWQVAKAAYDKVVAECATTKTTPAHNYWEKAHLARSRYALARHVFNVLTA